MHKFQAAFVFGTAVVAGPVLAEQVTVTMSGGEYRPAHVTAAVGDTIRFVNDDQSAHNVFVPTVGFATDLGQQDPGQESTLTIGRTGRFEVECVFHSNMLLEVEAK